MQLARYRETFSPGGAKDDRPDSELLCELLYCHRDRLKAWKPDTELNRKLAFFNEGRREAVDQGTRLSNAIKSQLKVYFPLALELLDDDTSTALAADLLLKWPTLEALQLPKNALSGGRVLELEWVPAPGARRRTDSNSEGRSCGRNPGAGVSAMV